MSRSTEFKFELESIKAKYLELQHEMDALQKQVEHGAPSPAAGAKAGVAGGAGGKNQGPSAWSSGRRKLPHLLILGVKIRSSWRWTLFYLFIFILRVAK